MILQQIKDSYAIVKSGMKWNDFVAGKLATEIDEHINICMGHYAFACCKATLEKAAENASLEWEELGINMNYNIDKSSITNPSNIVLL